MDESDIFPTTKKLLSNLGSGSQWPVFKVRAPSLTLTALAASHTRVSLHNRPVCPHLWCLQTRVSLMTPRARAPCHLTRGLRWNKQQQSVLLCKADVNRILPRSRLICFLRGSSLIIFCWLLREVGPGSRLFIMRNVIIVIFWGFSCVTMTPDIVHVSGKKVSWVTCGDNKPRDTSRS